MNAGLRWARVRSHDHPSRSREPLVDTVSTTPGPRGEINLVGQTVADRYRVLDRLGSGGMGAVFRVQDQRDGSLHALKALRPSLIGSADAFGRFRREARVPSSIGHPNIVDVTDFGRTDEGNPFFVMEYLEGEDLGRLLKRNGSAPSMLAVGGCEREPAASGRSRTE